MTHHVTDSQVAVHRPEINQSDLRARVKRDGLFVGYGLNDGLPTHIPHQFLGRDGVIVSPAEAAWNDLDRLLAYQQIQRGGGVVVFDATGWSDRLRELYRFCIASDRIEDLLIFNPFEPAHSNTYNAVLRGTPDSIASRVLALAPETGSSPGADHYHQVASYGLTVIVAALQVIGLAFNARDLAILLQQYLALVELEEKLKASHPGHDATRNLSLFLRETCAHPFKQKELFGGISGRLFMYGTGKFGEVMNTYTPDIDLFSAVRSNKIVYVAGSCMVKDSTLRNLVRMFALDLFDAAAMVHAADQAAPDYLPTLVVPGDWRDVRNVIPARNTSMSVAREIVGQVAVPHLTLEPPDQIVPQRFAHPPVKGVDLHLRIDDYLTPAEA